MSIDLSSGSHFTANLLNHMRAALPFSAAQILLGIGAVTLLVVAVYALKLSSDPQVTADDSRPQQVLTPASQPSYITGPELLDSPDFAIDSNAAPKDETPKSDSPVDVQLHVNGQSVPLEEDGTVHKEISTNNSKTKIDMSVQSSSSGSSNSHSSTSMNVDIHSSSKAKSHGSDW